MFSRLPTLLKFAAGFVLAEFFLANPTQQLYQWFTTKWQPTVPDFIPAGLLAGIGFGLAAAFYFIRRDEPGWWREFDLNKRVYEGETISMRSIARACHTRDKVLPVRRLEFRNCTFIGPDVAVFFGTTRMVNNQWNDPGSILEIPQGVTIVGSVAFTECEFDDCTFEKVQPLLAPPLHAAMMDDQRRQRERAQAPRPPDAV